MEFLSASAIPVVPLAEIMTRAGAVAITFDDGFANFTTHALPVLSRFRLPATVFAVSGYCGRRNDWPTQASGIPLLPIMSWDALKDVSLTGIDVGAHTIDHPRLTELKDSEVDWQTRASQAEIENRLGLPVRHFSYPYGDVDARVRRIVGRYFDSASSVELDYVTGSSDVLSLPRLDAYYLKEPVWFERVGQPAGVGYVWIRRQLRTVRALITR